MARKAVTFNRRKAIVLAVLQRSELPVKSSVLAFTADATSHETTNAPIRKVIRALISDGHAVASCKDGYYLVRNTDDLHKFLLDQNRKIGAFARRTDEILENFMTS